MVRKSMTALVNRLCIVPIAALLVLSASTRAPSLRVWSVRRQSWIRTDSGCEAEASLAVSCDSRRLFSGANCGQTAPAVGDRV